jgi:hypothetical protein
MARRGATTRDPKKTKAPARGTQQPPAQQQAAQKNANRGASKWNRTGPGTYKDQYGNVLKGQKSAPKKDMSQRRKAPAPPTQPAPPTPEQITEQGFRGSADLYGGMMEEFRNFDPYQAQGKYEPVYSQEMERARQNIMGQFERRNAEEFERQNIDTQRQIAERGLDPNSPAAQALMKQNTQRQDLVRQEAMSAAEQAADARQQQLYGQSMGTAGMRYDIYGSTFAPTYQTGIAAQYGQQQQEQQQDWQARQAELDRRNQRWMLRNQPRGGGGGGGGGADPYAAFNQYVAGQMMSGYGQQQRQPNLGSSAIGGIASGASQAITGNILRQG